MSEHDTIAAIATAPGQAAIAMLRISGPEAITILDRIFSAQRPLTDAAPRTALFGRIQTGDEVVDEVLVTLFRGPASYTGENLVEVTCHGGPIVTARILKLLLDHGARAAGPGEFTQRAFLHGKMDLTQAEAVMDLISAHSELAARAAARQLEGRLGSEIMALRDSLMTSLAHLEAYIDFPEEGIEPDTRAAMLARIDALVTRIQELVGTAETGRILREGVRLVIAGAPNAGKSSLLNQLVGYDRAIVTEVPGTTRDTIDEFISLQGVPFRIVDTAGLRNVEDLVETAGIARARAAVKDADLVVHLIDSMHPTPNEVQLRPDEIRVYNKTDLAPAPAGALGISCETGDGIEALVALLLERSQTTSLDAAASLGAVNARHKNCLRKAAAALENAAAQLRDEIEPEFVAIDLHAALAAVGDIVGETDTEDILGKIFSTFCIGK